MDLSVVVVSHNVRPHLKACLESVREAFAHANFEAEALVVDNASDDGSQELVRSAFPEVRLVANPSNSGYGAACNQGASSSTGEYLLFLNADTAPFPESIDRLHSWLRSRPGFAIAGPRLENGEGRSQRSIRRFPAPGLWLVEGSILERAAPFERVLNWYRPLVEGDGEDLEVDWLEGACLLVRREAFFEVGGFDERFFLYCEELDLCRSLRGAGWNVGYSPSAVVAHLGGASSSQNPAVSRAHFIRSKAVYAAKVWGPGFGGFCAAYHLAAISAELTIQACKLLIPLPGWHRRAAAAVSLLRTIRELFPTGSPGLGFAEPGRD